MEEETKRTERDFELRSEKVRSIVGQVPPALVRYGTMVIAGVLACLVAIGCLLPYKRVYTGTAIVGKAADKAATDSVELAIRLRFGSQRPDGVAGMPILLETPSGSVAGRMTNLSPLRDTLGYQTAQARFERTEIRRAESQTVDFRLTRSSGNLLREMVFSSRRIP